SVTAKPNRPPTISIDELSTRSVPAGEAVTLTATASDDGVPSPPPQRGRGDNPNVAIVDGVRLLTVRERPITQAIVKPSRQGLAVTWTHWRGPGKVTFDPTTMAVKDGKATTRVTFSEPGTYVIRAYSEDGDGLFRFVGDYTENNNAKLIPFIGKQVEVKGTRDRYTDYSIAIRPTRITVVK